MSLKYYELFTLVDITETKNTNPSGNTKSYKQNQNLRTILQSLSMRAQILIDNVIILEKDSKKLKFGDVYTGKLKYWKMTFTCDVIDPWKKDDDLFFFAENDLNNIPVYENLDEEVYSSGLIITKSNTKNTYIKMLTKS